MLYLSCPYVFNLKMALSNLYLIVTPFIIVDHGYNSQCTILFESYQTHSITYFDLYVYI